MNLTVSPRVALAAALGMALLVAGPAGADPQAQTLDQVVFEQLKALAGRWEGHVEDDTGTPLAVEYQVTSHGQAVVEKLFAGAPHEMTTVYYLAYDRLQATHYCSIGNQPALKLVGTSTPKDFMLEFAGGTGFDPRTDQHAHGVHFALPEDGRLKVDWEFRKGRERPTFARMSLARVESPDRAAEAR